MSLREAAQQALAYIEEVDYGPYDRQPVINALRAALAEPQTTHWEGCEEVHPECRKPEPVAWELRMGKTDRVLMEITNNPQRAQDWRASLCEVVPLYYAPTPRQWVGLTDAELAELSDAKLGSYDLCLEVEAKLKEKNHE